MKVFRDTVSGFTHLGGAVVSIVGTIFLCLRAGSGAELATFLIFGISMILLFSASASYHLITNMAVADAFRKLDHAMIYILIAGTYTPIVMAVFDASLRLAYMIGIWMFALVGVMLKVFFTGKFRIISTIIYLIMGWSVIFAIVPLVKSLGAGGSIVLTTGGVLYTIGGVIYATKRPKLWKNFGFHELFHIFVLLGAITMFFVVYYFMTSA